MKSINILLAACMFGFLFDPMDGGSMMLQSVVTFYQIIGCPISEDTNYRSLLTTFGDNTRADRQGLHLHTVLMYEYYVRANHAKLHPRADKRMLQTEGLFPYLP
jgi:hypothetical protein